MIWVAAVTVLLSVATAAAATRAAWLWWRASHVLDLGEPVASASDAIEPYVYGLQAEVDALKASAPTNRAAAIWTAWAAGLGGLTTLWSTVAPLFVH